METREFLLHARLDTEALDTWIEAGWLLPRPETEAQRFAQIDIARAQLIASCGKVTASMLTAWGSSLICWIRCMVCGACCVLSAVNAQPEEMRRTIVAQI
jgi:hypothetical protein